MQPIRGRFSISSFNSVSLFELVGDKFFSGIRTCSISSSSLASGILATLVKLTIYVGILLRKNKVLNPKESHQSNYWQFKKVPHHLFSRQCRSQKWGKEEGNSLKYLFPRRFLTVTVSSNRSSSGITVYRSGRLPNNKFRVDCGPVQISVLHILPFEATTWNLIF